MTAALAVASSSVELDLRRELFHEVVGYEVVGRPSIEAKPIECMVVESS